MQDNLHIYYAFGNDQSIMIEGRILEERLFSRVSRLDNIFKNIWRKIKQLHNNEIKNRDVHLHIGTDRYVSRSDDEGYFFFDIRLKKPLEQGYHDIPIEVENHSVKHLLRVPIMIEQGVGIISDFDDTLIISDVPHKVKLAYNLLAKNYKQRKVVEGMKERFEAILSQNPKDFPSPLFILTGSPKQLFDAINPFLEYHHFPSHQLIAKQLHGDASDSLFDQLSYKTKEIERLFAFYPKMEWVLFGDSGEKDKEVYERISKKYPNQVRAYYIRDVESGEINETIVK
jgi:phosphatidate phosphatase APP1